MEEDRMTIEEFGEKSPVEKRRWPRIEIEGFCFIEQKEGMYRIRNIGPGGIRISSPTEFDAGEKFKLQVSLRDGYQFETVGYVVWCLEQPENVKDNYEVGFKFVSLQTEDFKHIKKLIRLSF
jgi:hypothetical protein